jgi:hypothetical protein
VLADLRLIATSAEASLPPADKDGVGELEWV